MIENIFVNYAISKEILKLKFYMDYYKAIGYSYDDSRLLMVMGLWGAIKSCQLTKEEASLLVNILEKAEINPTINGMKEAFNSAIYLLKKPHKEQD
jgi:hypothetical protein